MFWEGANYNVPVFESFTEPSGRVLGEISDKYLIVDGAESLVCSVGAINHSSRHTEKQ